MDMFKKDDELIISPEFKEIVSLSTNGAVIPTDGAAKIHSTIVCESGQTLFWIEFKNEESAEDSYQLAKFPATVAQVQKMAKLQKKADKAAGIIKPASVPKKVEPVKAEPDDGYDPFADASADF